MEQQSPIKITAPAKVNLFLHITGKRENGYHELQSLVSFANFGDHITITPADEFALSFDSTAENLPTDDNNIIMCAANLLASELNRDLNCHIHLSKNIPIGAGLGGGSSDAAATIHGLLKFWNVTMTEEALNPILLNLGADVPACYHSAPCYFAGIGEIITPTKLPAPLPAILVYPNKHCSTKEIFSSKILSSSEKIIFPENFKDTDDLISFLKDQKNDMAEAAIETIPDIENILSALEKQKGCLLPRMSGSGSACFGLFNSIENAKNAADTLRRENPEWWIQTVTL